jgi:hypothetical protein
MLSIYETHILHCTMHTLLTVLSIDTYLNINAPSVVGYQTANAQSTFIPRVPQCLSVHSPELGLPHPLSSPPPTEQKGEGTRSPAGEGSNSDDWRKGLEICLL